MRKIGIFVILVMLTLLAKSQDSTDYTLNNIKRYATQIEVSFTSISNNIKSNEQQAAAQAAEDVKAFIDSIKAEMEYLPDEYYYRLSSLVSAYYTDVDEFEKLLLNKDFLGRNNYLSQAFTGLRQRQSEFRNALSAAYNTALHLTPTPEDKAGSITAANTAPDVEQQSTTNSNNTAANGSETVLIEAVEPQEINTSSNMLLLDTIHEAQQQIEQWINNVRMAVNKNNVSNIRIYAGYIANASLKIGDLALLLKTDQKQNLFILANGLKNASKTLQELTYKSNGVNDEMQDYIEKITIKFSTLSTGIRLVQ